MALNGVHTSAKTEQSLKIQSSWTYLTMLKKVKKKETLDLHQTVIK